MRTLIHIYIHSYMKGTTQIKETSLLPLLPLLLAVVVLLLALSMTMLLGHNLPGFRRQ